MAEKKTENEAALADVKDKASAESALQGAAYEKSQAVADAEQKLAEYRQGEPGEYVSGYQSRIDDMLDQIQNRGGFAYDFNADPLYQSYKDQYAHAGRLAMQDAQAAAQAANGGYGSSYSASAGSQAYQGYLNNFNAALPELYEAALARWNAEGDAMQNTLSGLTTQEKNARAAYESSVSDYYKGLSQYADLADCAYQSEYGAYQDRMASLTDARDYYAGQEEQSFKNDMSRKDYELALEKFRENVREWEAEQAAAREKWQAQLAEEQSEFAQEMAYKAASAAKTSSSASRTSSARSSSSSRSSSAQSGSSGSSSGGSGTDKQKADYILSGMAASANRLKK